MDKKTISTMKKMFDDIMHTTEDGTVEFWYARELMGCLGYTTWRRFKDAINRAMESCKSAEIEVSDHFADAVKMVEIGSNAVRDVDDIMLTRYACYLIAQNGDPRKEEIAFAQSYFAVQTRKQELIEERIAYIMNMYTNPEYRRNGIAIKTLGLLVEDAKKRGVHAISLEATDMGKPLYVKFGFVKMNDEMELLD